jgi:hypothetical protein
MANMKERVKELMQEALHLHAQAGKTMEVTGNLSAQNEAWNEAYHTSVHHYNATRELHRDLERAYQTFVRTSPYLDQI